MVHLIAPASHKHQSRSTASKGVANSLVLLARRLICHTWSIAEYRLSEVLEHAHTGIFLAILKCGTVQVHMQNLDSESLVHLKMWQLWAKVCCDKAFTASCIQRLCSWYCAHSFYIEKPEEACLEVVYQQYSRHLIINPLAIRSTQLLLNLAVI